MATEPKPADQPAIELVPAAQRGEPWWPVALAIIVVPKMTAADAGANIYKPVLPDAEFARLVTEDANVAQITQALAAVAAGETVFEPGLSNRPAAGALRRDRRVYAHNPGGLLAVGGVIWVTNVVAFGLCYWDLDRGGAAARAHHPDRNPAFVFPEMQHTDYAGTAWVPRFIDYLALAFWTAMAFSPTDTSAIKPWAKLLMMLEAAGSIALAALVIARAINIL